MSRPVQDAHLIDEDSFKYIYEQNVSVPLLSVESSTSQSNIIRCNVYRPRGEGRFPVLVTYGPYGKDIPYKDFHASSFEQVNPDHKSEHSAWETPDPLYWTNSGYAVVRADEMGTGQSPGILDTMSRATSEAFFDVVEWAAEQSWSSGKVGLLGISYYAGSQWRVAARRPKGLAAIIPWEGMSDYYRDRCRHGGILANGFISFWWNRQIITNQYGKPGRQASNWGPDTVDGDLPEEALMKNRNDQVVDNAKNKYRDDVYYSSKEYSLEDIEVPVLSVANWGGITVHLRGNVEGFTHAGSTFKYLRFITGRHDLPLYYAECVDVQKSFLDAFLLGKDSVGWSVPGKVAPVDLVLRKGDIGVNKTDIERQAFQRRSEWEWPLARTRYTNFYLTPEKGLQLEKPDFKNPTRLTYHALGTETNPQSLTFTSAPFDAETEITGHVTAHINVSMDADPSSTTPSDIDLFVTLRHIGPSGKEISYTGSAGDAQPLCKGWQRVSLRKVNDKHPRHRPWLPHRDYFSTDVLPVIPGEIYGVVIELWPTNVVVEKKGRIAFEVSSGDVAGTGLFRHDHPDDRPASIFQGKNHIRFGSKTENYVVLPLIPSQ